MDALHVILAFLPIVVLLLALGVFKLPAHWATPAVFLLTCVLGIAVWNMRLVDVASASGEGAALALWPIMLVIIAAIFTYNVAVKTGSLDIIKRMLVSISPDRRVQVLILAWGFGGFLEAVAGYGTAVAIPASILAALGFNPIFAAVISLIANTVPTAFGAVGIPVATLAQITGLPVASVSLAVALQLTPFIVLIPFVLVMMTGRTRSADDKPAKALRHRNQNDRAHTVSGRGGVAGRETGETYVRGFAALKGVWPVALASGVAFAVPQLLAAAFLGAELPALLGSLCSMLVTILMVRRRNRTAAKAATADMSGRAAASTVPAAAQANAIAGARVKTEPADAGGAISGATALEPITPKRALVAWLPYILVFVFVILISPLIPPLYHALGSVASSFVMYTGEHAKAAVFKWIATPGVLIVLAAFIGGRVQGMRFGTLLRTLGSTIWKLRFSIVTVVSILAMAKVMGYSGMISDIAGFIVTVAGPVYPLIASFLGTLGTFVTGSDTSSNILFGSLQTEVAGRIGADPTWIAAANTAGATAGKMISPQSIAVATSATGLTGKEGEILSKTILFCLGYVLALGLLVWALAGIARFG